MIHSISIPAMAINAGARFANCAVAAIVLLASGCAVKPIKPIPYQDSDPQVWFSGSSVGMLDPDKLSYEEAQAAFAAKRYAEAIDRYRELASDGVVEAAYELGVVHLHGYGVPRNPGLAAQWFIAALSKSNSRWAHASYYLGTMFLDGEGVPQNVQLAKRLLEQAVTNGYVRANLPLARIYATGVGVEPDIARAEQLARASADAGDLESHIWLLRGHVPGGVLGEDSREAGILSAKTVELLSQRIQTERDARAMRDLATIFYEGLGRPKDTATAIHWLNEAAAAGRPDYLTNLGRNILKGTNGHQANPRQGFKILEAAANRFKHPDAMALVAECLRDGLGTRPDLAAAEAWFDRAIDAGSVEAALEYGRMLVARAGDPGATRRGVELLEKAAQHDMPLAWAKLGELHVDNAFPGADPQRGVALLQRAHKAGIPSATSRLGQAYLEGRGVRVDPAKAEALLNQAARQGQPGAIVNLGQAHLSGTVLPRRPGEAKRWLEQAAAGGHSGAMFLLGRSYLEGADSPRDPREGQRWLEEAAGRGHSGAMYLLGRTILEGQIPNSKPLEAMVWLHQAIDLGNMDAAYTLGSAYLWGKYGLARDTRTGRQLLEQSAAADRTAAQRELGAALIKPQGTGLKPDATRGMQLLQSAARKGDAYAMQLLGSTYLEGATGVKPDPEKAEIWLKRAAEAGDVPSMTTLGTAYVDGNVLDRRASKGIRYLRRAASQGDDTARTKLGHVYLYGADGISPQPEEGEKYLKRAVQNGHAGAQAALGRAYVNGTLGEGRVAEGARLLLQAARAKHPTARYVLAEAFLKSQGLESVNREYAQDWLQTVVGSNTEVALQTLTQMLREANAASSGSAPGSKGG